MTTVELLGAFWVFRLVEITWGNLMERRRSREHELRQPGSPLVIGPKPPSWERCVLVICCCCFWFFLSYHIFFFCSRVWKQFKRELWYTLVGLTHPNGEFNCRPRNRWLLLLRMRFIEKRKEKWTPVESIINDRCFTLRLFSVTWNLRKIHERNSAAVKRDDFPVGVRAY